MTDIDSLAYNARLLALQGQRETAIADYERLVADMDAGVRYAAEGDVRSDFASLLRELDDPREADQLIKAVAAYQHYKSFAGMVNACLRLAELNRHSETAALYWADRAVSAAERAGAAPAIGRALAMRGRVLLTSNRTEDAVIALQKAVELPGGDAYVADLANAQILAKRPQQGIEMLERALAAAESEPAGGGLERIVILRMQLADGRHVAGDRDGAIAVLEATGPIAARAGATLEALQLDRLSTLLLEAGNAAAAANTIERAIERLRQSPQVAGPMLASLYNTLGNALAVVGHDDGAVRAFAEMVRLTRGVNLQSEALAHFGLANSAARLGATTAARQAYDEARALAVRLSDPPLEAACLDSLGVLLAKEGDAAHAVDLQRRAASLHRKAHDARGEHTDLMNLAESLLLLGETAAARRVMDDARAVAQTLGPELTWEHLLIEGRVRALEGRWPEARQSFDAALARLETERASMQSPGDQRRWAARRVEAFEFASAAAFEARDALAALTYLEDNRARFLEAMSERRRQLPASLPAEVRKAYVAAADRLADVRARRRERPDAKDPALEAEYAEAERVYLPLSAEVERARGGETVAPQPTPPVERVAECLMPGEVAVALYVTTGFLGVACIGRMRDGALWWACDVDPRLTLAHLSRAVIGSAEGDTEASYPAWQDLARLGIEDAAQLVDQTIAWLGERVWPLIERVLDERADALVLMPGRGLNVLPLHAAMTSDGTRAMERWSVRYAPSLRLIALAGSPGVLPAARVLGQAINPSGNLPFAECEAVAVRQRWKGTRAFPLLGPQAQPERVLPLFERTDVLHFAGHGLFDLEDPLRSRLICAPGEAGNVITLQVLLESVPAARTRVVLLSACETGRVAAGDQLNDHLGLPGGLLIAGASAILATHWSIDDLAAGLVLSRCIDAWGSRAVDLERALAEAQAWLRDKATVAAVREWIREQIEAHGGLGPEVESMHDQLVACRQDELMFASPLYWAPFHVTGRAIRLQ